MRSRRLDANVIHLIRFLSIVYMAFMVFAHMIFATWFTWYSLALYLYMALRLHVIMFT